MFRAFKLGLISKAEARRLLGLDAEPSGPSDSPAPTAAAPARSPGRRQRRRRVAELPERPAWLRYMLDAYAADADPDTTAAHRQAIAEACQRNSVGTQSWPDAGDVEAAIAQVNWFFQYWSELADAGEEDAELEDALEALSAWLVESPPPRGVDTFAEHLIGRWLAERRS